MWPSFSCAPLRALVRVMSGVTLPEMTPAIIWFSVLLIVVAVLTKVVGCGLGAKLCHYQNYQAARIGVGMISRGEVALIVANRGLELGVNFFDTAIGYQSGTSEQYLGRALRDFAKREDVVVATKFLPRTQEEIAGGVSGQQHIETLVNTSLRNLGLGQNAA